jgi:hypothetical protein
MTPFQNPLTTSSRLGAASCAAALALALVTSSADADTWRWSLTPYAWLTDVGVKAEVGDREIVDETISVGDLIEDLDTIFQGKFEGSNGKYGFATDVFDVTLSDGKTAVALPQDAGTADLEAEMGMTVVDLAGTIDPNGNRTGFSLMGGTRIINERATVDAAVSPASGGTTTKTYDSSDTTIDTLLGVRYSKRLSKHFGLATQADFSTGGTDYTWSLAPSLTYAFGQYGQFGVNVGYRTMTVNFQNDDELEPEMTMSGVLVGFRTSF